MVVAHDEKAFAHVFTMTWWPTKTSTPAPGSGHATVAAAPAVITSI